MNMYHRAQKKSPTDRSDERKLLTRESIERGSKTSKGEKTKMLGVKTPKKAIKKKK